MDVQLADMDVVKSFPPRTVPDILALRDIMKLYAANFPVGLQCEHISHPPPPPQQPALDTSTTAGACLHWLLHDVCVHALLCGARYSELELIVGRTLWHTPRTAPSVRSDASQAAFTL